MVILVYQLNMSVMGHRAQLVTGFKSFKGLANGITFRFDPGEIDKEIL
jgi:hypothetical protein